MRTSALTLLALCVGLSSMCLIGCPEEPIGQPCTFTWPKVQNTTGEATVDCSALPLCHPLQEYRETMGSQPANDACPVDCIQLPSLECTNLVCVATQIEGEGADTKMNGMCSPDVDMGNCAGEANFACQGYCTKECLSDASCPKGYRCSSMAPFGENLQCANEDEWGDGDGDLSRKCTDACTATGQSPAGHSDIRCPSSKVGENDYNYALCDYNEYRSCCACICHQFCPLTKKKFCRKIGWDDGIFKDGVTNASNCTSGG